MALWGTVVASPSCMNGTFGATFTGIPGGSFLIIILSYDLLEQLGRLGI